MAVTVVAPVAVDHPCVVHLAEHAGAVAGVLWIALGIYPASTVCASHRTKCAHSAGKTRRDTTGQLARVARMELSGIPEICLRLRLAVLRLPADSSGAKEVQNDRAEFRGILGVVETVLAPANRNTDFVEKSFVRVDVTEEFPFLVTKLSPYYDR
jgi:hypothetical protein